MSRLPPDVRWAMAGWSWGADEAKRKHIHDAQPTTQAEIIADIRRGLATADMIRRDIYDCNSNRHGDPLRWAADLVRQPDRFSMLAAIGDELRRLLDELEAKSGRG